MSVTNNSPSRDSFHKHEQIPSRYVTPGFKPISILLVHSIQFLSSSAQHEGMEKNWPTLSSLQAIFSNMDSISWQNSFDFFFLVSEES